MTQPSISLIAAMTTDGGIGKNNALLWHEPRDQKHFREVTMGHPVIMGRRTWDSLPERFRPLPGRPNIVLSRQKTWQAPGALSAHSMTDALAHAKGANKVFVIGGAEIYALALPMADELVLTEIATHLPADAYFPPWDRQDFTEYARESHTTPSGVSFSFVTYRRKQGD